MGFGNLPLRRCPNGGLLTPEERAEALKKCEWWAETFRLARESGRRTVDPSDFEVAVGLALKLAEENEEQAEHFWAMEDNYLGRLAASEERAALLIRMASTLVGRIEAEGGHGYTVHELARQLRAALTPEPEEKA